MRPSAERPRSESEASPRIRGLSPAELDKRKAFVNEFYAKSPGWWQDNMQLIIDGVTLTKAPKPLTARQRHMAQGIKSMWILEGEQYDNAMHNYNRYGIQLGQKVPLWGGFTGHGKFTLREWTARPKMTKEDWVQHLPAMKRAAYADKQQTRCRRTCGRTMKGFCASRISTGHKA